MRLNYLMQSNGSCALTRSLMRRLASSSSVTLDSKLPPRSPLLVEGILLLGPRRLDGSELPRRCPQLRSLSFGWRHSRCLILSSDNIAEQTLDVLTRSAVWPLLLDEAPTLSQWDPAFSLPHCSLARYLTLLLRSP